MIRYRSLSEALDRLIFSERFKLPHVIKYFFEVILFAVFAAALANLSVKPTEGNNDAKKAHFNNVNYNYYAGPNTKRIEQQLAEMKQEIRALKENQTGCSVSSGLFSEVKQQFAEIKQEIRALKVNQTGRAVRVKVTCLLR